MQTSIEKKEGCKIALNIEVDKDKVNKTFDKIYKQLSKTTDIAGFRKGKVPKVIINSFFGKDLISKTAQEELLNEIYPQALEKEKIQPLAEPQFEDLPPLEEDKSYKFSVILEVKPQIEIDDYKGLKLIKKRYEINEEEINNRLYLLQETQAIWKPVEDRGLKENDIMDLEVRLKEGEDEEFEEELEKYLETKGRATDFTKEFLQKLYGLRIDEKKEMKLLLPADFTKEEYQNKEVDIIVEIKGIKEKILPEINDDFAKELNYDDLNALKKDIERRLEIEKEEKQRKDLESQLIDKLIEKATFDVPEGLLKAEKERALKYFEMNLRLYGVDKKDYIIGDRLKDEEQEKELTEMIEKKVKSDLILLRIAEKENIEVKEEEIDKKISELATLVRRNKEVFKKELEEQNRISIIEEELKIAKTLNLLLENAIIETE